MTNPERSTELCNVLDDLINGAAYKISDNELLVEGDLNGYPLSELFCALLERTIELQDAVEELDLLDE